MATSHQAKDHNDLILEFLEVAVNAILHSRKIYASSAFVERKKYGIPVRITTHPRIKKYIIECLKTARQLLEGNYLKTFTVVLIKRSKTVERHIFELSYLGSEHHDDYYVLTEEAFRSYILNLALSANPSLFMGNDDCSFSIELTTTVQSSVELSDSPAQAHFPWLEVEADTESVPKYSIVPLKTIFTEEVCLQMYIESNS